MSFSPALKRLGSIHRQLNMSTHSKPTIAFIGGGNMAEAILGGLSSAGHPPALLCYSEPYEARRHYMQSKYPSIQSQQDNHTAVQGADVIVLAVKPQVMRTVVQDLAPTLAKNRTALIISIAAGITTADILRWIQCDTVAVVRCMPNTPALLGEGAVGLYATQQVNAAQRSTTEGIMTAIAKQVSWVEKEGLIDAVTGVSGSGPAYFFLMMEAMQNAGVEAGLSSEDAKALTVQTCLGAARMAQASEDDLATLRQKVTSPHGTTEAAIRSLESNQIRSIIKEAIFAAEHRSRELAEEMGRDTAH